MKNAHLPTEEAIKRFVSALRSDTIVQVRDKYTDKEILNDEVDSEVIADDAFSSVDVEVEFNALVESIVNEEMPGLKDIALNNIELEEENRLEDMYQRMSTIVAL